MFDCDLKSVVFGQDLVIDVFVVLIKMVCVGFGKMDKLIGVFLFFGLMGVGKIEVVCQFVFMFGIELICFDMLEYMECYVVSWLIGVLLGYVGFDQGGLLIEVVMKKLYCVLLFDEIEKVYLDIFNVLLQVMDYGMLMDNNGCKVDFCNVIIIMMMNVGVELMQKVMIGFMMCCEMGDEMIDIKCLFMLEFCNCLDVIISFCLFDEEIIMCVVDKFLIQFEEQLYEKKVDVFFIDVLCKYFVKYGFDLLMGVWLMQWLIQDMIWCVLVDELLFGKFFNGGYVMVDVDESDKVQLLFDKLVNLLYKLNEEMVEVE